MASATAPDEAWHYPPELIELTVQAVALLNRGKATELAFFRGAGVPPVMLSDLQAALAADRDAISKFEIARRVITRLNEAGDSMIRPRRELLNRIVRTESVEHCWPDDRLRVKGIIAEIRKVVNERDAFTRMTQERERESEARRREARVAAEALRRTRAKREQVRRDLFALFGEADPRARGKELERVLARLFELDGIGIREAFHRVGDQGEGIVEQIDGVIELDGEVYLVEMKWLSQPVGVEELSPHLVRLFGRSDARGIFISQSGFTEPAITMSREALAQKVAILCELEELVLLLEQDGDLAGYLREKVRAAIAERRPLHRP